MQEIFRGITTRSTLLKIFHQSKNTFPHSRISLPLFPTIPTHHSSFFTTSWIAVQRTNTHNDGKTENLGSKSGSKGSGDTVDVHFKLSKERMKQLSSSHESNCPATPVYKETDLSSVETTHYKPNKMHDRVALLGVKLMRKGFDIASRYKGPGGGMTKRDWLNRCLFLETVAGVPGMVAGMARHLKSLRTMQRDNGWIHTLLEEAENERMHLLIFMQLKDPNFMFRAMVIGAQGIFFNMFFLSYLVSPKTCHRFVGYLEEEAVKTYTSLLADIEAGHLKEWSKEPAPNIAKLYYQLGDDAVVKDVIKCIRADEANHRDVNHTFAGLDAKKDANPFNDKNRTP